MSIDRRLPHTAILVRAQWDAEAGVWVATSDDVQGLATEADTLEALQAKLSVMIPELMQANAIMSDLSEIPVHIFAEQTMRVANPRPNT
jgi:predicted RNase H-like HicB family nuclease